MSTCLPGSGGELSLVAPGDRASLHAAARDLRRLAHALRRARDTQDEHARLPADDLGGDTGASFRRGAGNAMISLHQLRWTCTVGATAFDQLGWDMRHLQQLYDKVRARARHGRGLLSMDETALVPPAGVTAAPPPLVPTGPTMPDLPALAPTIQAWQYALHAYGIAEDYRVAAQKAFIDTLSSVGYGQRIDTGVLHPRWHSGVPYRPAPPPDERPHGHRLRHRLDDKRSHSTTLKTQPPMTLLPSPVDSDRHPHADLAIDHDDAVAIDSAHRHRLHQRIEETVADIDRLRAKLAHLEGLRRYDPDGTPALPSRVAEEVSRFKQQIHTDQLQIAAWRRELRPEQLALAYPPVSARPWVVHAF